MNFYQCRFDVPQIRDVSSQDCIKLIRQLILITFRHTFVNIPLRKHILRSSLNFSFKIDYK